MVPCPSTAALGDTLPLATATPGAAGVPFSPVIMLTLVVIVAASLVMFWLLVRRWTSHRQWVGLAEWARQEGYKFKPPPDGRPPPPLDKLSRHYPLVRFCLARHQTTLLQLEADPLADGVPGARPGPGPSLTWNLLIRRIEAAWPPTGLRPVTVPLIDPDAAARPGLAPGLAPGLSAAGGRPSLPVAVAPPPAESVSVLDLFSLSSFPTLGGSERFVVYGTDSAAARALANSSVRALLPADVGLLLHGEHLVLDFSSRPFDAIEFNRMRTLAAQLVTHLPAVTAAG